MIGVMFLAGLTTSVASATDLFCGETETNISSWISSDVGKIGDWDHDDIVWYTPTGLTVSGWVQGPHLFLDVVRDSNSTLLMSSSSDSSGGELLVNPATSDCADILSILEVVSFCFDMVEADKAQDAAIAFCD
jgi:hypothetical protein